MEKILDVANYIFNAYKELTQSEIDEMKLHKLLYFAQRESIALTGEPLFESDFEGWRYGPVSPEVRSKFSQCGIQINNSSVKDETKYILNNIIMEYGIYESWKLSEMSHKEISWINSRKGLSNNDCGSTKLSLDDIREDAKKVRPYDHVWDMYYDEFEDAEVTDK